MRQVLTTLSALLISAIAGTAMANCVADTNQSDFQAGVANSLDLTSSPGNVLLAQSAGGGGSATLDQQNTTLTSSGEVFSNTQWNAQTFTAGLSGALTRVDLNLFCYLCSTAPPSIIVSIRATSGGLPTGSDLAVTSGTINSNGVPAFYTFNFTTPATVSSGTQYAIVIRSSSAPTSGKLAFTNSATSSAQGNDVYGGGSLQFSTNSGSSWSVQTYGTTPTSDGGFKTYVGGGSSGYVSAGDLVSSLKDSAPPAGTTPTWGSFLWTISTPANTAVKFQAAASNNSAGPFTFVGPDGTANTYFTSGSSLSQFNGNRYLKYHSFLSTANSASTPVLNDVTVCYSSTTSTNADLVITNTDGVASAAPGGSVTYTITASNSGPTNATNVNVVDTFPSALTCSWTCSGASGGSCAAGSGNGNINQTSVSLPSGGSVTYSATCSIAASATGSLVNTATVSSASITDTNTANNTATDTDTLAPQADLQISNTDNTTTATPGGNVTYTITALNNGPSNVTGAQVTDAFPASLTCSWTCAGAGGGTCTASGSGNISAAVNLPASASVTYTASCAVSAVASGTLTNTATIAAPNGVTDPNTGNNSATDSDTLSASTNIALTITDNTDQVRIGDVVDYVIELTNTNGPSSATVSVTDTLPSQLTSGSWVCTASNGATCGSGSGTGNKLTDSPTLPNGGKVDYLYTATVASANSNGQVSNTATAKVTSGGNQSALNLSASDADFVVIFVSTFEGSGVATPTTASYHGGASMTLQFGVDAGLTNSAVGSTPVTIATGRAADGAALFRLQLVRFGGELAMRTLTTLDGGTFSDASPWAPVNLAHGTLELTWQPATARGDDGFLRAGSLPLSATDARAGLATLQIATERGVPWLVTLGR